VALYEAGSLRRHVITGCRGRDGLDGVGSEADSMDGVRFGYEREVEENTAYTRARLGSDTERGEGRAAAGARRPADSWSDPLRLAEEELGSRLLRPNGPAACEAGQRLAGLRRRKG
jgi:hypothetical protein